MTGYVCIAGTGLAVMFFAALIITAYYIYRGVFVYPESERDEPDYIPDSALYHGMESDLAGCMKNMKNDSSKELSVMSYDGLRLCGRLYEGDANAPVVIFFHGYHGTYMRDGYGMFRFCREHGYRILLVDERAHGKSDGDTITFGIKEMHDCISWIKLVDNMYTENAGIIIAGVSMGASAVLMAAGYKEGTAIPKSVIAVIADCAFTSVRDIIKSMCQKLHYPVHISYALAWLGALVFGHMNISSTAVASAEAAVSGIRIPVLFIHGSNDSVVPSSMCDRLYNACTAYKKQLVISGADHAVNALTAYNAYADAVGEFIKKCGKGYYNEKSED